jgi:glycine betaine/proline transport system substrate-binding protein
LLLNARAFAKVGRFFDHWTRRFPMIRSLLAPLALALALLMPMAGMLDVVTPADRFEMDRLIAEGVSRKQPFAFYYWQPNAIISQFAFQPIDLGPYDHDAFQCLGRRVCNAGKVSAFAPEPVVVAVSDWVFTDVPLVAGYFTRATMPIAAMDTLLMQMGEADGSIESVADRFVAERRDIWGKWVGTP